ncbi:MAG: hypothetical protein ACE5IW_03035 [bacterium]
MKLGNKAVQRLQQFLIKENQKSIGGEIDKFIFDDDFDDIHLRVEIEDFDRFSFQIGKLELKNTAKFKVVKLTADGLKKRAEDLAAKVTYLLENLALVELDSVNLLAQIRSVSPYEEIDLLTYYEIIIDSQGSIRFGRFQQHPSQPRLQIPFKLTEDVFERLIDDFAEAVS